MHKVNLEKIISDPAYAKQAEALGLSKLQWTGLQLILNLKKQVTPPTATESKVLSLFITQSQGDMAFNALLQKNQNLIEALSKAVNVSGEQVATLLNDFTQITFLTRHFQDNPGVFKKVSVLNSKLTSKQTIQPDERLTLSELGLMHNVAKLNPLLERYKLIFPDNLLLVQYARDCQQLDRKISPQRSIGSATPFWQMKAHGHDAAFNACVCHSSSENKPTHDGSQNAP